MIKHHYASEGHRPLEQIKGLKIIDIGGANSFADNYLDAIVDMRVPQASAKHIFTGNMDYPEVWEKVLKHVEKHGKWDYCICTHTLEDINNPVYVSSVIEKIAKKGLLVFPSKFRELGRFEHGGHRGFIHHRWIFEVRDGKLIALPKINYIENPFFDQISQQPFFEELIVEWEGSIDMVNGMISMETQEDIRKLYEALI